VPCSGVRGDKEQLEHKARRQAEHGGAVDVDEESRGRSFFWSFMLSIMIWPGGLVESATVAKVKAPLNGRVCGRACLGSI
jgi:hypothetical protein